MATTIFVVEDDESIRELILYALVSGGYEAEGFEKGAPFFEALLHRRPNLVLLDIMLPDGSGLDLLDRFKALRKQGNVIIISARDSIEDKVSGLDLGADDYLAKPFHLAELSARIKSVMRRNRGNGENTIKLGNVVVSPDKFQVSVNGADVPLLRKEYDILYYFILRPGHLVDKSVLAEAVWGDHIDQADNFDFIYAQMKNLRKKLRDAGAEIEIKSVYGFGYKLVVAG